MATLTIFSTLVTCFIATGMLFALFSAAACYSKSYNTLYLSGIIGLLSLIILVFALTTLFFPAVYRLIVTTELVMFCVWVMYDTKAMIKRAKAGSDDAYLSALLFFLDFAKMVVNVSKLKKRK